MQRIPREETEAMLTETRARIQRKIDANPEKFVKLLRDIGKLLSGNDSDIILGVMAYLVDSLAEQGLPAHLSIALLASRTNNAVVLDLVEELEAPS